MENENEEDEDGGIKVSLAMDIKFIIFSTIKNQDIKRPPAPLNMTCGVCSAAAPDHLHFGGKVQPTKTFSYSRIF